MCGSAFKNKAVQHLLDAIVYYLPSPLDRGDVNGVDIDTVEHITRAPSIDESFSALAFKVINDPFVGSLTFIRAYSGSFKSGDFLYNPLKDKKERIGRIMRMHADKRVDIKTVVAGDIVALAGLKDTSTGDTLCDPKHPIILEKIIIPEPVVEMAIEARSAADQEKLSVALSRLVAEDPSLTMSSNKETGQTTLNGMGELHLDIVVDRLKREFNVNVEIGEPQVAYRETLTKEVTVDYTHKKQTGGAGQFARVKMDFIPINSVEEEEDALIAAAPPKKRDAVRLALQKDRDPHFVFENRIVGGAIPKEYIPSVKDGISMASKTGVIAGFPVVSFKVILYDGSYHDVDSSQLAFEIAARAAFREACLKAATCLMEPVMQVEVISPNEYASTIIGDLNSRRGLIQSVDAHVATQTIKASVPLASMFGYISDLRSASQGRAQYTMIFDKYQKVPAYIQEEIVKKRNFSS
jgi:elongation factor G